MMFSTEMNWKLGLEICYLPQNWYSQWVINFQLTNLKSVIAVSAEEIPCLMAKVARGRNDFISLFQCSLIHSVYINVYDCSECRGDAILDPGWGQQGPEAKHEGHNDHGIPLWELQTQRIHGQRWENLTILRKLSVIMNFTISISCRTLWPQHTPTIIQTQRIHGQERI